MTNMEALRMKIAAWRAHQDAHNAEAVALDAVLGRGPGC